MLKETEALVRYYFATTRVSVPVATCKACPAERALSPEVVVENGPPGRCATCGSSDIAIASYRVGPEGVVAVD